MNHLNYFEPYENKKTSHEDQLTRAFLVVMRFVPLVQATFLDLVREAQQRNGSEHIVPSLTTIDSECSIETQVSTIAQEEGTLVSILMTDEHWVPENAIGASERGARYDGVIYYSPGWILVIENKLSSANVWEGQLSPSLPQDSLIKVERVLVDIPWRLLIDRLNSLLERKLVNGAECLLVEDFLEFVDGNFPFLNPYGSFSQCKGRGFLLKKRCVAIMESIAPGRLRRRQGGDSHIILANGPATDAYFYPDRDYRETGENGEWRVAINIFPGDTIAQARKFFENVRRDEFLALEEKGWNIVPNLHFAFITTHLYWAKGTKMSPREYFESWSGDDEIGQIHRNKHDFQLYFQQLQDDGQISQADFIELAGIFTNTKKQTINTCPGFRVSFSWSKAEAEQADVQRGRFAEVVRFRMLEALATWGQTL